MLFVCKYSLFDWDNSDFEKNMGNVVSTINWVNWQVVDILVFQTITHSTV